MKHIHKWKTSAYLGRFKCDCGVYRDEIKKLKKFIVDKHFICAKCGGCYFSDKQAAILCYDEDVQNEKELKELNRIK